MPYDDKELYCIILFSRALFRRLLVTAVTVSAYAIIVVVVVVINNAHLFRQLIAPPPKKSLSTAVAQFNAALFESLGSTRDPSSSSHHAHSFHLGGRRRAGEKLYASS